MIKATPNPREFDAQFSISNDESFIRTNDPKLGAIITAYLEGNISDKLIESFVDMQLSEMKDVILGKETKKVKKGKK